MCLVITMVIELNAVPHRHTQTYTHTPTLPEEKIWWNLKILPRHFLELTLNLCRCGDFDLFEWINIDEPRELN